MRFRTKIILICCLSVLCSSIICSVTVYDLVKRISLDAAESQSYQNAHVTFSEIEEKISSLVVGKDDSMEHKVLDYILKTQGDEMLLCFASGDRETEIYNDTVFQQKDLSGLSYHSAEVLEQSIDVAEMKWEGRQFLVLRQEVNGVCVLYKLEEITYVLTRMRMLGIGLLLLTAAITAVVSLILFFILKRMLRPLQRLNEGAKQIARGQYDERVVIEQKDEVGELSSNFNAMAEAVQSRIQKLKEIEHKRTLFMGNLTHELKTPMTAISGYAKTLLTVKLPEEDREDALCYIYQESCRLERLSKKMMHLLLLEEDDSISLAEVSAERLFHNAEEACSQSLQESGIFLECHSAGESYLVDADLMTEVLINLIDNARKASSKGDRIILSARENVIEVQDFGRGIPKEEQEKILEPFYRIDKSRSRASGGAGLGLAITAMILKRHNCSIHMESGLGEGTRMILQFV